MKQPAKKFEMNQLSPTLSHLTSYFSHLHLIPLVLLATLHANFSSFHHLPAPKPSWIDNCPSLSNCADPHVITFTYLQLAPPPPLPAAMK
jgi:hypothetical protein